MGALNSSSCRGTLSFRLISGGSLLPKQHRKPRPGLVLFLGGMVAVVTQVAEVALARKVGEGAKGREGEWRGGWGCYLGGMICNREEKDREVYTETSVTCKGFNTFRQAYLMSQRMTETRPIYTPSNCSMFPWKELFVVYRKQSNLCYQQSQLVWKKYRKIHKQQQPLWPNNGKMLPEESSPREKQETDLEIQRDLEAMLGKYTAPRRASLFLSLCPYEHMPG